jgi:hypothetical protein
MRLRFLLGGMAASYPGQRRRTSLPIARHEARRPKHEPQGRANGRSLVNLLACQGMLAERMTMFEKLTLWLFVSPALGGL